VLVGVGDGVFVAVGVGVGVAVAVGVGVAVGVAVAVGVGVAVVVGATQFVPDTTRRFCPLHEYTQSSALKPCRPTFEAAHEGTALGRGKPRITAGSLA